MNENYNEKIHKIIENAFEEEKEYILEYANNKEYAFGKLEEKFKEFMQFEISQNDLEELQIDIENTPKGFNSKNFLAKYKNDEIKGGFLEKLYSVVSYIDVNAYEKKTYNEYEDNRTLAKVNLKPNHWAKYLIIYKKTKDLDKVSETVNNVILYINMPESRVTAFKNEKLYKFLKYVKSGSIIGETYEELCQEVFNYLEYLNIPVVNEKNRGIIYGRLIFTESLYKEWDNKNRDNNQLIAEFNSVKDSGINLEDEQDKYNDEESYNNINTPLNMILYGPPGTGKTYNTVNYAVSIIEKKEIDEVVNEAKENREAVFNRYKKYLKDKKIVFTTFHQNYGYEEFIQGIRANTNNSDTLSFVKENGIFKDLVEIAIAHPENNYVIIIDEINRGNISRIFGELITLIEDDKRIGRESETKVSLPSKEVFGVPSNLYIIGTMNTADKSIALIDIALRRRFDFIAMYPDYTVIPEFEHILKPINEAIYKNKRSADYLIGHAFFTNKSIDNLENIVNKKLIPLLNEYFYNNESEVVEILSKGGIEVEMNMNNFQLEYKGLVD